MLTASIQIFSLMQWQACSDVIHFLCLKNSFFETISALFPFFYITRHWISLCDSILFLLNWTGFNLGMKKKNCRGSEFHEMWVQIPELPFMSCVSKQFIMCALLFLSEKSGQGITGFINKYMPQIVQHRVRLSKKYLIISSSSLKKDTTSIFQPMCWVVHSKCTTFGDLLNLS